MGKIGVLNATQIKLFAIILMVGDHVHQMFNGFGAPSWLTYPGRLVFPLFLFLAADSFYYTRSRKKYLQRLLFASWSLTLLAAALQAALLNPTVVLANNAFSTFFLVGLYIVFWDRMLQGFREKNTWKVVSALLLSLVPILSALPVMFIMQYIDHLPLQVVRTLIILSMLAPNLLLVEGGIITVFLGVAFYVLRKSRWAQVAVLVFVAAIVFKFNPSRQWLMGFAAIPMLLYNGERGKGFKWFFYIFYPAHLFILYALATVLA